MPWLLLRGRRGILRTNSRVSLFLWGRPGHARVGRSRRTNNRRLFRSFSESVRFSCFRRTKEATARGLSTVPAPGRKWRTSNRPSPTNTRGLLWTPGYPQCAHAACKNDGALFDQKIQHRYSRGFLNQIQLRASSITYHTNLALARYYAPYGRFLSIDPAAESMDLENPQSFNPDEPAAFPRAADKAGDAVGRLRRLPFDDADRFSEVKKTLDRIDGGGTFPHSKDGTVLGNCDGLVPEGNYREFTVDTPAASTRGLRRIVVDENSGRAFYVDDHYKNFVEIDKK